MLYGIEFDIIDMEVPTPPETHIRIFEMAPHIGHLNSTDALIQLMVRNDERGKNWHSLIKAKLTGPMLTDSPPYLSKGNLTGLMEALNKKFAIHSVMLALPRSDADSEPAHIKRGCGNPKYIRHVYMECFGVGKHFLFGLNEQGEMNDEYLSRDDDFFGVQLVTNHDMESDRSSPNSLNKLLDFFHKNNPSGAYKN
jgi:hypothetical protein